MIYVLDFGSQYSHLITRRIRELGVYAKLVAPDYPVSKLKNARAVILSGGPQNLSEKGALRVDKKIFKLGLPVLGICYGMQLMAFELGGSVRAGKKREYGPTEITIVRPTPVFQNLTPKQMTWMSHGDQVARPPKGFTVTAVSDNCPIAAIADEKRKFYGLQFHPEVIHTKNGNRILQNFLKISKSRKDWSMKGYIKNQIVNIKKQIGNNKAICALSGGVDSAVATAMVSRAIGKNLISIYVDTGLMRKGETAQIKKSFKNLKIVTAEKEFLSALKGISDPEKKRKIIGNLFIKIFEREATRLRKNFGAVKFLVQGTLYTDAISSGVSSGGKHAAVIKSHHNVGGLPKKLGLGLVEPLRDLYKYEVRKLGKELGLPQAIYNRQPFPGPGLAVRIIGTVSKEKLEIVREADAIVCEEIEKSKINVQQYFAVLADIKSVGVQGDARTYGHPIIVRAITTHDFMTADWTRLPHSLLEKISNRITNEIREVNRVVYDITSKPPGTVEWE